VARIADSTELPAELFTPFSVPSRLGHKEAWDLIDMALDPED
jgi:hypothetical protein